MATALFRLAKIASSRRDGRISSVLRSENAERSGERRRMGQDERPRWHTVEKNVSSFSPARCDARVGSKRFTVDELEVSKLVRKFRRRGTLEGASARRRGSATPRDIKLLEITSAYYFNFVDCLTAVTPWIRGRNCRESFLRIISPRYGTERGATLHPHLGPLLPPTCRISLTVSEGICWTEPLPPALSKINLVAATGGAREKGIGRRSSTSREANK